MSDIPSAEDLDVIAHEADVRRATSSQWIQTFTGKKFYPFDPRPEDVRIEDIAHALSLLCRFTGHVKTFYSVADHSWHVSHRVPQEHALWGLLHDASEAYLNDISRPVKRHESMLAYAAAETRVMQCVAERFGLPPEPECVREVDRTMLLTERRDLLAPMEWPDAHRTDWDLAHAGPLYGTILPMTSAQAELAFLSRFYALTR